MESRLSRKTRIALRARLSGRSRKPAQTTQCRTGTVNTTSGWQRLKQFCRQCRDDAVYDACPVSVLCSKITTLANTKFNGFYNKLQKHQNRKAVTTVKRLCKLSALWTQTDYSIHLIVLYHLLNTLDLQGGPKKGSHYRESSLNRIKNRQPG